MRRRPVGTILIGPSALLREGLARILTAADFRIIASACAIGDAVVPSSEKALLLILDVGDDPEGAIEQIARFREQHPNCRIALIDVQERLSGVVAAFRAGANAYFGKVASSEAFIKLLELVMLGETILPSAVLALVLDSEHERSEGPVRELVSSLEAAAASEGPRLSAREKGILRCLAEGDSNKVIARKVAIAEATVKVHVKAILRKIRVHNRTQAAIWAMNHAPMIWGPPKPDALAGNLTTEVGCELVGENAAAAASLSLPPEASASELELAPVERVVRIGLQRRHL